MQRPSLRERVLNPTPKGKDIFFSNTDKPSTNDDQPFTLDDLLETEDAQRPTWNDLHQRVTFYCPKDLVEKIESTMKATKRSKSQLITIALESLLSKKNQK